jgi:hypothetical protein
MQEIVGYEDIVGEDDGNDVISGAQGQKLLAKNLPQSFVGVPLTTITASSTGQSIAVPVLRNIRPDRLVIDRVQAASALVYDIRIGTVSLNASSNPVPGDMFAPDAVGTSIRCTETATPSVGITIIIGNRTATAITSISCGFIGPSTKPN